MERWREREDKQKEKEKNCTVHSFQVWKREITALELVCLCVHAYRKKDTTTDTRAKERRERVPYCC